jgi:hypothetical protein
MSMPWGFFGQLWTNPGSSTPIVSAHYFSNLLQLVRYTVKNALVQCVSNNTTQNNLICRMQVKTSAFKFCGGFLCRDTNKGYSSMLC